MLARLALSWVLNAVVLALVAGIFSGVTFNGSVGTLVIAAAVFGVLNTLLKPILKLLTFPLAIFTLGLAWFGVAMFMLWLTDAIVPELRHQRLLDARRRDDRRLGRESRPRSHPRPQR